MADNEDNEYEVKEILHRMEFDALIQKALAGKYIFCPDSLVENEKTHSKYAYLVHWKGYLLADRTWEPESNLEDSEQLVQFKREHNYSEDHETIEKQYGDTFWAKLSTASQKVTDHLYLLSPEEKEEEKSKRKRQREKVFPEDEMRADRLLKQDKMRKKAAKSDDSNVKQHIQEEVGISGEGSSNKLIFKIPKIPKNKPSSSDSIDETPEEDDQQSNQMGQGPSSSSTGSAKDPQEKDKEESRSWNKPLEPNTIRIPKKIWDNGTKQRTTQLPQQLSEGPSTTTTREPIILKLTKTQDGYEKKSSKSSSSESAPSSSKKARNDNYNQVMDVQQKPEPTTSQNLKNNPELLIAAPTEKSTLFERKTSLSSIEETTSGKTTPSYANKPSNKPQLGQEKAGTPSTFQIPQKAPEPEKVASRATLKQDVSLTSFSKEQVPVKQKKKDDGSVVKKSGSSSNVDGPLHFQIASSSRKTDNEDENQQLPVQKAGTSVTIPQKARELENVASTTKLQQDVPSTLPSREQAPIKQQKKDDGSVGKKSQSSSSVDGPIPCKIATASIKKENADGIQQLPVQKTANPSQKKTQNVTQHPEFQLDGPSTSHSKEQWSYDGTMRRKIAPSRALISTVPQQEQLNRKVSRSSSNEHQVNENAKVETEEERIAREQQLNEAYQKREEVMAKLNNFPIQVSASRAHRAFTEPLLLRKRRRCGSEERLGEFSNKNAELEIFAKNFEACSRVYENNVQAVIKQFPSKKPDDILDPTSLRSHVIEENMLIFQKMDHPFKSAVQSILPNLITAYSKDDNARFKAIFSKIPDRKEFLIHRYAVIVFMINYFNHKDWKADRWRLNFSGANVVTRDNEIRSQSPLCSDNHRKCTWMKLFMELIPSQYRFIETSGKDFNGDGEDDGPFRDEVYFHCMKYGAECQKRLFFQLNKPIGLHQDRMDDFRVDGMHHLAVQYGNVQRIASYIAMGGVDINALATCTLTNRVYRLQDFLRIWVETNVKRKTSGDYVKYFDNLLGMVRHTAEALEWFVRDQVNHMITTRMNMMWKIHMNITFPHIIRCSPMNNKDNSGDGAHQVLTCLFSPLGIGFEDGIPHEIERDEEDNNVVKMKLDVGKYSNLVAKKQGRLLVALYRVEVEYTADVEEGYAVPNFKHVSSNDGFVINEVKLFRQSQNVPEDEAIINLAHHKALTSPGALYYVIEDEEVEKNRIVPGNTLIEINGHFDQAMSFVAQIFYIKKNF